MKSVRTYLVVFIWYIEITGASRSVIGIMAPAAAVIVDAKCDVTHH